MKINTPLLIVAAAAMTGCVNWNSFNSASSPQRTAGGPTASPAPVTAKPTPTPKAQAKPTPKAQAQPVALPKASPTPVAAPAKSSPPPAPAAPVSTPKPAPTVIKEERTSETKVISSRPVVGTDADMGQ